MEQIDFTVISSALSLPLYWYRDKKLLSAFPAHAAMFAPPAFYLKTAFEPDNTDPYLETVFHAFYGRIPLNETASEVLIVGPVAQLPYRDEDFRRICAEYRMENEGRDACIRFFQGIPWYLKEEFGKILRMIHHFCGCKTPLIFQGFSTEKQPTAPKAHSVAGIYDRSYLDEPDDTMLYEEILTGIVASGRPERIDELTEAFFQFDTGKLANEPLRNLKNTIIAAITLMTRAAIHAGVAMRLAFRLSDYYILAMENADNPDDAAEQFVSALRSLTCEVAAVKNYTNDGGSFRAIINYVREHTDRPLTVAHLAAQFGYNSNYLSGTFKKETGTSLSALITRTKLETACELLQYTNKSILEISEHLCFSSQNYFQTVFKKQYGITPLMYRKQRTSVKK